MKKALANPNQQGQYMTTQSSVQSHPSSIGAYIRHGWSLVPIPFGTKGPKVPGWNLKENALQSETLLPQNYGIGLSHAYSGTMALDIDVWDRAALELSKHGVNLQALYEAPDAVIIDSGRAGHGKLLYKMPFGLALTSKKLIDVDDEGKNYNYLDFRCATANKLTMQDVLPPSIHPETLRPYQWAGKGHWMRLPEIPSALLNVWIGLLNADKERTISSGENIDASWEEIQQALTHISADCSREEWINCGMALHWAGSQTDQLDQALFIWDDWSQASVKYPGERAIATQWKSFRTDKTNAVKLGTLFHYARQNGWTRPTPDVSSLFGKVEAKAPKRLLSELRQPPPDLDFELMPSILRRRALEVSENRGCDPLIPLFAGLAAACGAADARTRLELMPGFEVPPVLWITTIGKPAGKKSPGSKPMVKLFDEMKREDHKRLAKEQLNFEVEEARYLSAKKAFIEHAQTPEAMLSNALPPSIPAPPSRPVELRITVTDVTSQKLVRHAAERPRGLLCFLDEMNGWIQKICDPRSGEDRSAWVSAYESEPYEMDRVGAGTIYAENYAVSMYANVQPRVFTKNIEGLSRDGLIQRFIPVILRSEMSRLNHPTDDELTSRSEYDQYLRMIFALPVMKYKLTPEAFTEYRAFQVWYYDKLKDYELLQYSDLFLDAFGKLEGLCGRLALVFHLFEQPFASHVSKDTMSRVIEMVKSYIVPSLKYTHNGALSGTSSFDEWLIQYVIMHCDRPYMSLSDIKHSAKRQLKDVNVWDADRMVIGAMMIMEQNGWVARVDDGTKEHQHIANWAINPSMAEIFKEDRKEVLAAKQRELNEIYKLSTKEKPKIKNYDLLED